MTDPKRAFKMPTTNKKGEKSMRVSVKERPCVEADVI